jgi:hypothetical protein
MIKLSFRVKTSELEKLANGDMITVEIKKIKFNIALVNKNEQNG